MLLTRVEPDQLAGQFHSAYGLIDSFAPSRSSAGANCPIILTTVMLAMHVLVPL